MPLFSSDALNAIAFGVIAYLIQYAVSKKDPDIASGKLIFSVGIVPGLILLALGASGQESQGYLYKLWACSFVIASWGAAEIAHAVIRDQIANQ